MNFLLFLAPFSWGTQKREAAAPKASGCFMGGTCAVREEPGKQKPRSCRAQELARSRAQENARQKKGRPSELCPNRLERQTQRNENAPTIPAKPRRAVSYCPDLGFSCSTSRSKSSRVYDLPSYSNRTASFSKNVTVSISPLFNSVTAPFSANALTFPFSLTKRCISWYLKAISGVLQNHCTCFSC